MIFRCPLVRSNNLKRVPSKDKNKQTKKATHTHTTSKIELVMGKSSGPMSVNLDKEPFDGHHFTWDLCPANTPEVPFEFIATRLSQPKEPLRTGSQDFHRRGNGSSPTDLSSADLVQWGPQPFAQNTWPSLVQVASPTEPNLRKIPWLLQTPEFVWARDPKAFGWGKWALHLSKSNNHGPRLTRLLVLALAVVDLRDQDDRAGLRLD